MVWYRRQIAHCKSMNKVFSLTRDRLNAFSSPVRPSSRQYSVNATNSTDIRDKRPDISETYKLSESTKRAYEYSVLSDVYAVSVGSGYHSPTGWIYNLEQSSYLGTKVRKQGCRGVYILFDITGRLQHQKEISNENIFWNIKRTYFLALVLGLLFLCLSLTNEVSSVSYNSSSIRSVARCKFSAVASAPWRISFRKKACVMGLDIV